MTAPRWEVADVIRLVGTRFVYSLPRAQQKVLNAIARCRTAALGGHCDRCVSCGHQEIKFNSCRNRHCPKCQVNAREKWLRKRRQELLPIGYFHIVFSVPHQLIPLMWQNKKLLFSLLFQATGVTLLEVAADSNRLGGDISFLCILHTWGQTMNKHPHLHCVMPGGGLSLDHTRWISSHPRFFLPVKVLSIVFRDKFLDELKQTIKALGGEITFLRREPGAWSLTRVSVPRDVGAPPHDHDFDESYYVLSGSLWLMVSGQEVVLGAAEFIHIPGRMRNLPVT